ncbi:hypothetical protein UNSW1_741 [Campylobacter concisus UNSW1]|nr:hypothetical protein UNSW1_741 [Campylobacter concisus UNSW1]
MPNFIFMQFLLLWRIYMQGKLLGCLQAKNSRIFIGLHS